MQVAVLIWKSLNSGSVGGLTENSYLRPNFETREPNSCRKYLLGCTSNRIEPGRRKSDSTDCEQMKWHFWEGGRGNVGKLNEHHVEESTMRESYP